MATKDNVKLINIPRRVKDPHYRYKMPEMRTKVTGKHQGRATVIENLFDISKALERPAFYIMRFFAIELNTRVKCNDKTHVYSVHGNYGSEELMQVLDPFIDKFVLCQQCQAPETDIRVLGGKNKVLMKCRACGKEFEPEPTHKLYTVIVKKPPPDNSTKFKAKEEKKEEKEQEVIGMAVDPEISELISQAGEQTKEKKAKTKKPEDDITDWSVDTSPEAVEKRRLEALGNASKELTGSKEDKSDKMDPIVEMLQFLEAKLKEDPIDHPAVIKKVLDIKEREAWSSKKTLRTLFVVLFNEKILQQIQPRAPILRHFMADEKDQKWILILLEKLCMSKKDVIPQMTDILNAFYSEEILDEEILLKWYKHPNPKMNKKISTAIRKCAQPFIEWLETADSGEEYDFLE